MIEFSIVNEHEKRKKEKRSPKHLKNTFKEASSFSPISTESIVSIFPSPVRSFKSGTRLLLFSVASSPA
jgi:hypothetical protein